MSRPLHASVLSEAEGHLAFGYSKLFIDQAPGGNMSVSGGVDVPLAGNVRAGADVGFHLLGSRTVERGSLAVGVDYSLFEATALLHWLPLHAGPIGRVSGGIGIMSPRADLAASAGGAGFSDLAVEEVALGAAAEVTFQRRSTSPVRIGLQTGARVAFLEDDTWAIASIRFAILF